MLVNAPLSSDTDKEVRTRSEDFSDAVMGDVARAVNARVKRIDRAHDIPYIAGYSQNGETIYIDRHLPKSFQHKGKRVDIGRFLVVHEAIEKALLDQMGLHYLHAHQIALRTERAAVEAAGVEWEAYNRFTKSYEKPVGDERLQRVPEDLDLTPYLDEHDIKTLQRMIAATRPEDA